MTQATRTSHSLRASKVHPISFMGLWYQSRSIGTVIGRSLKYITLIKSEVAYVCLHEVRSEMMYKSAEGHPVAPRRRHIGHLDTAVAVGDTHTPVQQIHRRSLSNCSLLLPRLKQYHRHYLTLQPNLHDTGFPLHWLICVIRQTVLSSGRFLPTHTISPSLFFLPQSQTY